jgi:hypothetical protein
MEDSQNDNDSIFQEKYKVPPTPYKQVDNSIDQLDTILTVLYDSKDNLDFDEIRYKIKFLKLAISDFDLQIAIDKLLLDNYVANPKTEPNHVDSFYITYHGRLFLTKSQSFIFKNRPYKRQQIIETIQTIYTITKTVATISYSLIIVFIAYWSVKLTDKTNRLEDELKRSEQVHRMQIDSLTKMLNDTTRLKK